MTTSGSLTKEGALKMALKLGTEDRIKESYRRIFEKNPHRGKNSGMLHGWSHVVRELLSRSLARAQRRQGGARTNATCPPSKKNDDCIAAPRPSPNVYSVKTWQPAYPAFPDCYPIRPEPEEPAAKKLLKNAVKGSLLGYVLYWTYNEGIWGEPTESIAAYDKWIGPLVNEPDCGIDGKVVERKTCKPADPCIAKKAKKKDKAESNLPVDKDKDPCKIKADKKKAELERKKAAEEKAKAECRDRANKKKEEADKAKAAADKARLEADKAKAEADKTKAAAEKAKSDADKAKSEAEKAKCIEKPPEPKKIASC